MVVLYSDDNIGPVAPVALPAPLSVPSVLTMTQLLPDWPVVVVKLKLSKLAPERICVALRPLTLVCDPVPPPMAEPKLTVELK